MEHIIYKTTNLLNGRFYIGMHSTKNPDDGYLGSGKRLKAEVKKHGRENFKREILEILPTRNALEEREAQIVTKELRTDPLCLNLKNGGEGGGKIWSEDHRRKLTASTKKMLKERSFEEKSAIALKIAAKRKLNGTVYHLKTNHRAGIPLSEEAKKSISLGMIGKQSNEKNSQFGTCWVTDKIKPIKIKKEQLQEYLSLGYSKGRLKSVGV